MQTNYRLKQCQKKNGFFCCVLTKRHCIILSVRLASFKCHLISISLLPLRLLDGSGPLAASGAGLSFILCNFNPTAPIPWCKETFLCHWHVFLTKSKWSTFFLQKETKLAWASQEISRLLWNQLVLLEFITISSHLTILKSTTLL